MEWNQPYYASRAHETGWNRGGTVPPGSPKPDKAIHPRRSRTSSQGKSRPALRIKDYMQERQNIAVFVDYDNIEIGVKSTLRREFDVSLPLDALKERGDIVAKFAYANWSRQEPAVRQMAENAVQMVQRLPSPRGDKNGADINLALDALEMAFTHKNVNAFAIISGDSDFIPLVNKLRGYGKTIYIVGGKAFTSNILQQNCHEFISYESLLTDDVRVIPERKYVLGPVREPAPPREQIARDQAPPPREQAPENRLRRRARVVLNLPAASPAAIVATAPSPSKSPKPCPSSNERSACCSVVVFSRNSDSSRAR